MDQDRHHPGHPRAGFGMALAVDALGFGSRLKLSLAGFPGMAIGDGGKVRIHGQGWHGGRTAG